MFGFSWAMPNILRDGNISSFAARQLPKRCHISVIEENHAALKRMYTTRVATNVQILRSSTITGSGMCARQVSARW
jgi:hypothetical protein